MKNVAVVLENTPAGQDFLNNVVGPIGEQKLGLKIQTILVDPANADYAVSGRHGRRPAGPRHLGSAHRARCIGLATATNQLGFKGPVLVGSCPPTSRSLGDKAVGTYTSGGVFIPEIAKFAPTEIQAREDLATYTVSLRRPATAVPQRLRRRAVLERCSSSSRSWRPSGPVNAAVIKQAFTRRQDLAGYLGPDLHCGEAVADARSRTAGPTSSSEGRRRHADRLAQQPTATPGFQDFAGLVKWPTPRGRSEVLEPIPRFRSARFGARSIYAALGDGAGRHVQGHRHHQLRGRRRWACGRRLRLSTRCPPQRRPRRARRLVPEKVHSSAVHRPLPACWRCASAALIGLVAHFLVFRPLRKAPPLAKVVASVGSDAHPAGARRDPLQEHAPLGRCDPAEPDRAPRRRRPSP